MPAGVAPIKRKVFVVEFAILAYLCMVELAEVVHIQLKQVREDGLLLPGGGEKLNVRGWLVCVFGHSPVSRLSCGLACVSVRFLPRALRNWRRDEIREERI